MTEVSDELIDRFLDGEASAQEAAAVLQWLETAANLERYAMRAALHADLRRSLGRRRIQENARYELEDAGSADPHDALTLACSVSLRSETGSGSRRRMTAVAVAASFVALICTLFFLGRPSGDAISVGGRNRVARVAYQTQTSWIGKQLRRGETVGAGVLRLSSGMVRLDFTNGATVTLQGPAEFEILGPNQTRLRSGILTAAIPQSAVGFEVETPAMDVVDLGTAFGVSVGVDGETDVCVFEGEVEVSRSGNQMPEDTRLLREGDAVRSSPRRGDIDQIAYETNQFEDSWPVTSGVLSSTGMMKFVAPGPEFVPGRYEDDTRILVFLERRHVVCQADFNVDLVEPGQYQRLHRSEQHRVPAGTEVCSYLIQLDPVGRLAKNATHRPRVIGQVTFDRPVVGLIASSTKLNETDDLLGHPHGDYVKVRRGIEPPRSTVPRELGRDVVILSPDRRTLSIDLSAGTAIDQIRVVVEEAH